MHELYIHELSVASADPEFIYQTEIMNCKTFPRFVSLNQRGRRSVRVGKVHAFVALHTCANLFNFGEVGVC
jgi:hypothetical protein